MVRINYLQEKTDRDWVTAFEKAVDQWSPTPFLETYLPKDFSSNRNHVQVTI